MQLTRAALFFARGLNAEIFALQELMFDGRVCVCTLATARALLQNNQQQQQQQQHRWKRNTRVPIAPRVSNNNENTHKQEINKSKKTTKKKHKNENGND